MKKPILVLLAAFALLAASTAAFSQCSLVKDISITGVQSWPSNATNVNGTLYFSVGDVNTNSKDLYKSDGTEAGTVMIKQIQAQNLSDFVNLDGKLIFQTNSSNGQDAVWVSDGTAAGTIRLKAFQVNTFYTIVVIGHYAYFSASDGANGNQLYRTDGTVAGTIMLTDVGATTTNTVPTANIVGAGGWVYFFTNVGNQFQKKNELWRTNGTVAGTSQVTAFTSATTNSLITQITEVNGTLFFKHDDYFGPAGEELWKSDGTLAGTAMVKHASPSNLFTMNGLLYFTLPGTGSNVQLWRTDGTAAGTINTGTFDPGQAGSAMVKITVVGDKTYFLLGNNGTKMLYVTDGTALGTVPLYGVAPASRNINDIPMVAAGNVLYFSRVFGEKIQLMKTDGVVATSTMICDFDYVSANEYFMYEIGLVGQSIYFSPYVETVAQPYGKELWKYTDITIANKERVSLAGLKLSPNPAHSSLTIESQEMVKSIRVFNASGTIQAIPINGPKLDLTSVTPGLYLVRVQTAKGISTLKFVKE